MNLLRRAPAGPENRAEIAIAAVLGETPTNPRYRVPDAPWSSIPSPVALSFATAVTATLDAHVARTILIADYNDQVEVATTAAVAEVGKDAGVATAALVALCHALEREYFAHEFAELDSHIRVIQTKISADLMTSHDLLFRMYSTLRLLAYSSFAPWLSRRSELLTREFVERKGPESILAIIENSAVYEALPQVIALAASVVWNSSGSTDVCERWIALGAHDVVMDSFLRSPDSNMVDMGVGIIWGFLEYTEIQEWVAAEPYRVEPFCKALQDREAHSANAYRIIGCLLCLAQNPKCRSALVSDELIALVVDYLDEPDPPSVMQPYFCALLLSQLCFDADFVNHERFPVAMKSVRRWLRRSSPDRIRAEEEGSYVWKFLFHFVALVQSPVAEARRVGLFSLENMMQGHENRLCVFNEGLYSAIAAVAHSCDPYEAGAATRIVANFAGDSEGYDPVPSLVDLARLACCERFESAVANPDDLQYLPHALHGTVVAYQPFGEGESSDDDDDDDANDDGNGGGEALHDAVVGAVGDAVETADAP